MKIDIESYLGIIIMIIILIISGLGSRRRKQAQMKQAASSPAQPGTPKADDPSYPPSARPAMDPFERLEQILTGQSSYDTMEEASLEDLQDENEMIVDETPAAPPAPVLESDVESHDLNAEKEDVPQKNNLEGLFKDADEITRAVIYSEILPRKYI